MSSSSSSSSPPVVPQHCSTVSVLYELLKCEEEPCRVWLRDEMNQIPDPLIDSLFHGLICSSSSSVVAQSRPTVSELCKLLEGKKIEARMVLRGEMDRVVNTLFERLTNMLRMTNLDDLDREEDGGDDRAQVDQVESPTPQPSTSSFNPVPHEQHSNGDEVQLNTVEMIEIKEEVEDGEETRIIDMETLTEDRQVKREIEQEENEMTLHNDQIGHWVKREIKEEEEDGEMVEVKEEIKEEDEEEEEDGEVLEVKEEIKEEDEEVEEDGEMVEVKEEIKEEDDEEEDGEAEIDDIEGWAEDNQSGDDESRSVEKASMDTTPAHSTGQSQTNTNKSSRIVKRKREEPQAEVQTEETNRDNQQVEREDEGNDDAGEGTSQSVKRARPSRPTTSSDTQEKQIITHTVRCPEVDCPNTFTTVKLLSIHLKVKHSIDLYRCMTKDCAQSFTNSNILGEHLVQSHQQTIEWNCGKCPKHFATYHLLSRHNYHYHQLGHFECSFPACTFTGEYRQKVYDHYLNKHKQTLNCDHPGCTFRTAKASCLKQHLLIHFYIKPYRCKWPACDFAAAQKGVTIRHIRARHFALNSSSGPNGDQLGEPSDYVEVVHDLLQ